MKLLPFPRPGEGETLSVEGLHLHILRRGKGATSAKFQEKVPATLEFFAQALPNSSGAPPEKFASLEGTLELKGADRHPVFTNGPDAEGLPGTIQYDKPLQPEVRPLDRFRPRRSTLKITYNDQSFQGMMDVEFSNGHLVLPEFPDDTLFVEVQTKLVVDGSVEAEIDVNDRLDAVLFGLIGEIAPPTTAAFQLRDSAGRAPNQPIKFRINSDGTDHEGVTNRDGQGFVDGLRPGVFDLDLPEVAPGDYGAEAQPGVTSTDHRIAAQEDVPKASALSGYRDPKAVYDHPDNETLRSDRPNLNQLVEGDTLKLPPKDAIPLRFDTGTLNQVTLQSRPPELLRLNVLVDEPFSYELTVGTNSFRGGFDSSALIEHEVSVLADEGTLKLRLGNSAPFRELEWEIKMAALEPVTTNKGLQARLNHLGFDPQGVDGKIGKKTKAAIEAFQRTVGLDTTGEADEATQVELLNRHDEV